MAISNVPTEPGVFSQFKPTRTFPTSLGDSIVDEDLNTYYKDTDYQLTTGAVDWSLAAVASLTGTIDETFDMSAIKTLKLTIGGGTEQSHDISEIGNPGSYATPAAATAAEVALVLAALFTGITAADDSGKVKISTVADNNSSLLIGDGDANAVLGFTGGSLQETPREPIAGKTYSVNYEYAKASADYVPRFFYNMDSVIEEHGEVTTSNTLSLGAEIAIEQGASVVCLVQCDPADGADAYVKNHCDIASSITERKERTAIVGMSGSPTVSDLTTRAQALASKRMVLVSPGSATRYVGSGTTPSTLDGSFVATAIAGLRTSREFDVADPLTRKEVVGFETIADDFLRAEKVTMLSKGVMVIENVSGIYRVMQQVTTDVSVAENKEYSVVEVIDYVASNMREVLETIYIGQKILAGTPSQVKTTVQTILNDLISKEIIVDSQNVQAAIDNTDPTQINVSFEIRPVFPLNYILITFSLSPNI